MNTRLVPTFLAEPDFPGRAESPPAGHLAERVKEASRVTSDLARECARATAHEFEAPCLLLLGCETEDRSTMPGDWLETRQRLATHQAGETDPDRSVLLHAALVGLSRGASAEAMEYAECREISGTRLIDLDLLAARLFTLAANEMVAELQFARLCEWVDARTTASSGEEDAQHEIRRAALTVLVEGAQVRGGHGLVQFQGPGRRLEIAQALLRALSSGGEHRR